ncbi:MAG: RNA polymerase sigma factor [Ktedonobacterales bacterium]
MVDPSGATAGGDVAQPAASQSGAARDSRPDDTPSPAPDDTGALVELARSGDRDAFSALVARYQPQLHSYLAQLIRDDDQARDLAQDVFARAWDRLLELRDPARFRGWLFRMATNAARSWLRRRRLRAWVSLERGGRRDDLGADGGDTTPETLAARISSPESGFEERLAETQALSSALRRVPLEYRACLLLHAGLGFSIAEVAEQLALSPGAVRMRLHRGLALLRAAYFTDDGPSIADREVR